MAREDWWCGSKPLRCSFLRLYRLTTAKGLTVFELINGESEGDIEWSNLFCRPLLDREWDMVAAAVKEVGRVKLNPAGEDRLF
ncbi:hypothetical protein V6N13_129326 [Hibiscus sabdariffa]